MYYKIRNDVLFRQYSGFGYLSDNSEFGYQFLNDNHLHPGERYVSESGAVMLSTLDKEPRFIDDIVDELMQIFIEVDRDELKHDTMEFFDGLKDQGFLSSGETDDSCQDHALFKITGMDNNDNENPAYGTESCGKGVIRPNDFLRSIHFEIASACNERCVHCYIPHECKTKTIDSGLFYKILEAGRKLNIIHVTLSGGEPLLHQDFVHFLEKCRDLDLSVNVLSNLTLLTDSIITEMIKNPLLSVQTSIYSMDSSVHDSITHLEGSLEKTKTAVLRLADAGIPVQISCPIMKQNKNSFQDVIRWGKKYNIAVAVEPIIFASYDHIGDNLANRISLDDLGSVLDKQLPEGYAELMREAAIEKESLTEDNPICSICRYSFCVSAEGNMFPCAGWQTNILGDLNSESLQDVWELSPKIQNLRKIKRKDFLNCVKCKDRGYCTVCMMCNANENPDGNVFQINEFRCKAAEIAHRKVDDYFKDGQ